MPIYETNDDMKVCICNNRSTAIFTFHCSPQHCFLILFIRKNLSWAVQFVSKLAI